MQSLRQYRRLGKQLKEQIEREREVSVDEDKKKRCGHEKEGEDITSLDRSRNIDLTVLMRLGHISSTEITNTRNENIYIVQFAPSDPLNAQSFGKGRKWLYTFIVAAVGFVASGASAFDSGITPQAAAEFGVSTEVELLSTSLYMIAFGLGTLISAPFSETLGRNVVYLVALFVFMAFTVGSALSPNIQTQCVMRFLMGFFGSPPAVTFGGSMTDLWSPLDRIYIFPAVSFFTFLGPFLAPTVADYVATSPLPGIDWRFVEWITLFLAGTVFVLIFAFVPETYAPVLLRWKAQQLRKITADERYRAPIELEHPGLGTSLLRSLRRPWTYLFQEIIVGLFSLYLVVIYAVLFGFLVSFSYIFGRSGEGVYYLSQREVGLCYLPMCVGFVAVAGLLPWIWRRYKKKMKCSRDGRVEPEEHLLWSMIGTPMLPGSLVWMAFGARPDVSYWSPLIASGFFGFASLSIFITCYQYIIDSYQQYAASALVGMTVTRYVISAPIVIASEYMYSRMGLRDALLVWFAVSAVMTPVPYLFYRYGKRIRIFLFDRSKSTRATSFETK